MGTLFSSSFFRFLLRSWVEFDHYFEAKISIGKRKWQGGWFTTAWLDDDADNDFIYNRDSGVVAVMKPSLPLHYCQRLISLLSLSSSFFTFLFFFFLELHLLLYFVLFICRPLNWNMISMENSAIPYLPLGLRVVIFFFPFKVLYLLMAFEFSPILSQWLFLGFHLNCIKYTNFKILQLFESPDIHS